MNTPKELNYTKTHEWIKDLNNGTVEIGLTDYAQDALGDLVFVNLPQVGDSVTAGTTFCDVESVKAVSNIYSPISGTIRAINEDLLDQPELVNSDAMGAWFIEVENITEQAELLSEEEYQDFLKEQE